MTGLVALVAVLLMGSANMAYAQETDGNKVSGVVVDATGYPLVGVAVLIKGTTVGSSTDLDGKFAFELPSSVGGGTLLEFSCLGYKTQDVPLGTKRVFNVTKAGDVLSSNLDIVFEGLDKLDYSKQYVLPVTVATDGIEMLERSKTMYFVIKEASLVNFVADMKSNRAWPIWDNWEKVANLEQLTMECLINCHAFNNSSSILTVMGVEDHFLIRIGDVTIPTNQIQIALAYKDAVNGSTYRVSVTSEALQLRKDRWYHLAVTFDQGYVKVYLDGRLKAEADRSVLGMRPNLETGQSEEVLFKSANFSAPHSDESDGKPRCFWVGYSYDSERSLDGMIAEARLWNRVLTHEEINAPNHFYKLYPSEIDESLLAYWKFCEGFGQKVKDYSIYGKDLEADHTILWYPVELP